jgi:hypothetical protein
MILGYIMSDIASDIISALQAAARAGASAASTAGRDLSGAIETYVVPNLRDIGINVKAAPTPPMSPRRCSPAKATRSRK